MGGRVPEARHMKMRIDAHQGYPGELATIVGPPLDLQRTLLAKSPLSRDSPTATMKLGRRLVNFTVTTKSGAALGSFCAVSG
ncbi:hypothetical protein V495_02117 [Pseudogymnoascus sp. VKM F-4514 (FW-929)]|nr:hypothetical protein V495_02117 [Pseudogymnoascus sp. VKM F-4514 (FW-929)]KFY61549.1 hypothetical protein V497_02888 [Pseudogymnoascus sp. VKM F-4516 (FW-969)]